MRKKIEQKQKSKSNFLIFFLATLASSVLLCIYLNYQHLPSLWNILSYPPSLHSQALENLIPQSLKSILNTKNVAASGKIIAVGDLHGDYKNSLRTLMMAGIADSKGNWVAGTSTFVQTGDIVDRGDDTILLYEMMIRLRKQAKEAGGLVVPLLGNHEVMNMQHDFRYVTEGDVATFGGWEKRNYEWSKDGWIGKYLRELGVAALVNDTCFFHGGASVKWAKDTVDGINEASKKALDTLPPDQLRKVGLFGPTGPLWYRGYAQDDEAVVCPLLDEALEYLNATRMVVGHTPQLSGKVLKRCRGRVFVVDVGISRVYGGHSAALEIDGDIVTGLYPGGKRIKF